MSKKVRVRFAPSPTGGLHLGGVRTALYNYLFARKHQGEFILRIEDTDQSRYVPGAEEYIYETLNWCGISADESPLVGGPYGPYRQSERKSMYREYAEQLVRSGKAYYAFDMPEELESMRTRFKTEENPSPQYDYRLRPEMNNSLSLTLEETLRMIEDGVPHVIRIKIPDQETVTFTDMIRGEVSFQTSTLDDKVLLKADGMPTYHLAVVVDDYLMNISHAFRGEEWLPSAPVHVLLWRYLFGEEHMPLWAHLPLILKPDGNGKLSKRDSELYGFPIFGMDWKDPKTGEITSGFKERGFLREAFVNMLALLGWNDGSEQEIFSLQELEEKFSIARVHKGGAKFDFEKAKWINHEWIKRTSPENLVPAFRQILKANGVLIEDEQKFTSVVALVKDRCQLTTDFFHQASFFYLKPHSLDLASIQPKWTDPKKQFFAELIRAYQFISFWQASDLEHTFKEMAAASQIKPGDLLLPFRIMLVGGKFGPGVFDIATIIGKAETIERIEYAMTLL
jgi:glutamyl-tRNA synthetase